jgi:hypothetical protein
MIPSEVSTDDRVAVWKSEADIKNYDKGLQSLTTAEKARFAEQTDECAFSLWASFCSPVLIQLSARVLLQPTQTN